MQVAGTPPGPPPKNPSQAISGCCALEIEKGLARYRVRGGSLTALKNQGFCGFRACLREGESGLIGRASGRIPKSIERLPVRVLCCFCGFAVRESLECFEQLLGAALQ